MVVKVHLLMELAWWRSWEECCLECEHVLYNFTLHKSKSTLIPVLEGICLNYRRLHVSALNSDSEICLQNRYFVGGFHSKKIFELSRHRGSVTREQGFIYFAHHLKIDSYRSIFFEIKGRVWSSLPLTATDNAHCKDKYSKNNEAIQIYDRGLSLSHCPGIEACDFSHCQERQILQRSLYLVVHPLW